MGFTWHYLLGPRKTWYNVSLMLVFTLFGTAAIIDIIFAANYFQIESAPDVAHLPKLLNFVASIIMMQSEGVRLDFVCIVLQKSRRLVRKVLMCALCVGIGLFMLSLIFFITGVVKGKEAVPFHYVTFYMVWLMLGALFDVSISVAILHLSHRQTVFLKAYDTLTVKQVERYSTGFKIMSVVHIVVILSMGLLFSVSVTGDLGYSLAYIAAPTLPLTAAALLLSMLLLQRIGRAKTPSAAKATTSAPKPANLSKMATSNDFAGSSLTNMTDTTPVKVATGTA